MTFVDILVMRADFCMKFHLTGCQPLGEDRYRRVDVFLWQLVPDGLHGQLSTAVRTKLWRSSLT